MENQEALAAEQSQRPYTTGSAPKVGDTIYRFDINRRFYDKPGMGGNIIYDKHFDPHVITSETKQSWLITDGYGVVRVNKKTMHEAGKNGYSGYQWFTREGMTENIWSRDHRHRIVKLVEATDTRTLRKIGQMIGYAPAIEFQSAEHSL